MSELMRWRRRAEGDDGFALIVVMVVISIVTIMTIGMIATGLHLDQATARGRRHSVALQAAEAGLDQAVYQLSQDSLYTGTGGPVPVPGGQYEVTVTVPRRGWATIESTGYVPTKTAANVVKRRIRATYGPERAFRYALFSESGLEVKNNGETVGDVFANGSVILTNGSGVRGSVTSATGTVELDNGATVRKDDEGEGGDIRSGGYDLGGSWGVQLQSGAVVEGNVSARAEQCPGSAGDDSRYNVSNDGQIQGNAVARGNINGSVQGSKTPFTCVERQATQQLPQFHYDPELYPSPNEYGTSPDADGVATGARSAFQAWVAGHSSSMTGTHRIMDTGCRGDPSGSTSVIELGGTTITGEFTLITNCRLDFSNNAAYSGTSDAHVTIISLNASTNPAAIDIKNNFEIPDPGPAVLMYSPGLIQVKNNPGANGAVFAGSISFKNNMDVTYDERVERTVGFGSKRYERISWEEIPAT
jgi:type II secretory pathway pseudopilin PulG